MFDPAQEVQPLSSALAPRSSIELQLDEFLSGRTRDGCLWRRQRPRKRCSVCSYHPDPKPGGYMKRRPWYPPPQPWHKGAASPLAETGAFEKLLYAPMSIWRPHTLTLRVSLLYLSLCRLLRRGEGGAGVVAVSSRRFRTISMGSFSIEKMLQSQLRCVGNGKKPTFRFTGVAPRGRIDSQRTHHKRAKSCSATWLKPRM